LNPSFLWWLVPIVGSLMLSIPVSVISSRVNLGLKSRDESLFRSLRNTIRRKRCCPPTSTPTKTVGTR
jgi:membrane glycosyltransferase